LDAIGPRASYEPGRGMDDIDDLLAGLLWRERKNLT
jgi:hypothetical protein